MKKNVFLIALALGASVCTHAQVQLGFKISPNIFAARIKDNSPVPSSVNYSSDGSTIVEGNLKGIGVGFNADFPINDTWYFGTGLWFTSKNLHVRNTDGGYSGVSKYRLAYMQIPVLAKYRTGELFFDKFNLVFSAGPVLDIKLHEGLNGGDGAHYWNLAKDLSFNDPGRGHNGNQKSMALFAPINIGMYISAGAEYQLLDKMAVCAGFSFNPSFLNLINPKLRFDDAALTPVRNDVRFSGTIISFDLGIKLASLK